MKTPDILVSPLMVHGHIPDIHTTEFAVPDNSGEPFAGISDQAVISETLQIAAMRTARDNTKRTLFIGPEGFDDQHLDTLRLNAWRMSRAIVAYSQDDTGLYVLRAQSQFEEATCANLYTSDVAETDIFTRAEEGLLDDAESLIDTVKTRLTSPDKPEGTGLCPTDDDCVVRANQNAGQSHISLRGYTFSRKSSDRDKRIVFSTYPSCDVFRATVAREQIEISPNVVRIFARDMKNTEYAARTLLAASGLVEVPVESVALSDDGSINLLFSWHSNANRKQYVRSIVRGAAASQLSNPAS